MDRFTPDLESFRTLAGAHRWVPVYRQVLSDTLTPVTAYSRLRQYGPSFLFESVVGGERVGRYTFVGTGPFLEIQSYDRRVKLSGLETREYEADDPLAELERLLERYRGPLLPGLPRFTGGAVGYAGYDTVRYVEHLPNAPEDDRRLPDMRFAFYDRMIVFDHINKTILVVGHVSTEGADDEAAYAEGCRKVDELVGMIQQPTEPLQMLDIHPKATYPSEYESNFTQAEFEGIVRAAQEYIKAGDIFQVVLSQRLKRTTAAKPLDIYRALRVVNPSPFMFLLEYDGYQLIGSSPEIMVRVEDGETTIRPLAGTRPRGKTEAEDKQLERELLADEKERAEHIMLVDLARNDVGRVAKYGSVQISDVMKVERYSHVMHIASDVRGQLVEGKSALDALRSGLPAGTLSGAPKVRAMEIIDELETRRRGPYGGAVGYIDFTGNMDTCIALRTIVMQGDQVYLQAGAGVVADSVPTSEYEETLNKARGLLRAIDIAENQISNQSR